MDERPTEEDGDRSYIVTPIQEAMLLRSLSAPGGGHYIQQIVVTLPGTFRRDEMQRAWDAVASRCQALRAFYAWRKDMTLAQVFASSVAHPVHIATLSAATHIEQPLSQFLDQDRHQGFDLFAAPLWRFTALRRDAGHWTGIWTFHHALLDGRSHTKILDEVMSLYNATGPRVTTDTQGTRDVLPFLTWLEERPTGHARTYWRRLLEGFVSAPALPSLAIRPDAMEETGPHAEEALVLGEVDTGRLRNRADGCGVTLNNLVQAAWALVLARYTATHDITFGVTRSGRHWDDAPHPDAIGQFTQTVPFRVDASPDQPLAEWLQGFRRQQVAVRGHEFVSAAQIRFWADLPARTPLFRSVLMFETRSRREWRLETGEVAQLHERADQTNLAAYAGRELSLAIEFSPRVHCPAQARSVLQHLKTVLLSMCASSADTPIGRLGMLPEGERECVLKFGRGPQAKCRDLSLVRHLEAQARDHAKSIAVEFGALHLSYDDLHRRANQLARRLRLFVQPGERAFVFMDRSADQIVAWLALLKAGIVYAPIDPATPAQRLAFMCADLSPALVLTHGELAARIPAGERPIVLQDDGKERALQAQLSDAPLEHTPPPTAAACLLCTSGTTGNPKAALLAFASLENFLDTLLGAFDINQEDRILQLSNMTFDFTLGEMLLALSSGATLVMGPWADLQPGPALARFLSEQRITVLPATPSSLRATPTAPPDCLRLVLVGGEVLPGELVSDWGRGRRVINAFGPTECTFWATREECEPGEWHPALGRPVENSRLYVLDANLEPQPVGVPGELYIGGAGVGLGYWQRPEENARRFLPNPFADGGGSRMYRTGDQVRWLADGRLAFVGRLDDQVKFRALRVELGEIESHVASHPGVRDAVAMIHGETIEAWFLPQETPPEPAALAGWLGERLPLILIPSQFHVIEEYPMTRTGKIDRRALLSNGAHATRRELPDASWGDATEFDLSQSVVDLFLAQAQQQPDAPAAREPGRCTSYRDLANGAQVAATELLRAGLETEELVVVLLQRSTMFLEAILGILMGGGAYVPVDPEVPDARLEALLAESGSRFVLTDASGATRLATWSGSVIDLSAPAESATHGADPGVRPAPRPEHRAYVIFTSGSSGRPKGVEVEHSSLTNLVCHFRQHLAMGPGYGTTHLANVSFDASGTDIWPALCSGGFVSIPPAGLAKDPDRMIAWLVDEGVSCTFVPTGLAEILFERPWPDRVPLRVFLTGGDRLVLRPPETFPVRVVNTYGPTENTVDSTWAEVHAGTDAAGLPPIGRPISNVNAYVLDEEQAPVAPGQIGELYLGGAQIARGYLAQPDLTTKSFLPDPFSRRPRARMYRTGDLARWSEDGELEFLGRCDEQVQIRGFRIELAEIEATLVSHPDVKRVCCAPRETESRVTQVDAHVVLDAGTPVLAERLREHADHRLPDYMVPAAFFFHTEFPLTPAGKIDRAKLASLTESGDTQVSSTARESGLRLALGQLWYSLLPTARSAGPDLSFSSLGGDSLTAIRLQLGVEEITRKRVELSTLLLDTTLDGLCTAVEERLEQTAFQAILTLRATGPRRPLFCLYGADGDVSMYFDLIEALGDDQPVYGIRSRALENLSSAPDSIDEAADEVLGLLETLGAQDAPALLGYSFAGLTAFETARRLPRDGSSAGFAGLIGTASPPAAVTRAARLAHFAETIGPWALDLLRDQDERRPRLSRWRGMAKGAKETLGSGLPDAPMPDWASSPILQHFVRTATEYRPALGQAVQLDLFCEGAPDTQGGPRPHPLKARADLCTMEGGWGHWAGTPPRIHWVDGHHNNILKPPHVAGLARSIRCAMDAHYSRAPETQ